MPLGQGTDWLAAGLPYPRNVYPFEDSAGLVRTPFFMGYRGQSQKWKFSWRTYRLEFLVRGDQLRTLETYFWQASFQSSSIGGDDGYDWVRMPLISESALYPPTAGQDPPQQWVRIIAPPVIAAIGAGATPVSSQTGWFRVTLSIETKYRGAEPPDP